MNPWTGMLHEGTMLKLLKFKELYYDYKKGNTLYISLQYVVYGYIAIPNRLIYHSKYNQKVKQTRIAVLRKCWF